MASQLIQEIKLQDKGYSSGIKSAMDAVRQLGQENGIASNSIVNVQREMKSAQKYAMTLANAYRNLSEEAKQTDWGKAIEQEMNAAIQKAGELADLKGDIARQVKNIASDTRPWDTMNEAVGIFANGMQVAAGAIGAFTGDEKTALNMMNLASAAQGTLNTVTALGNALQKESNIMATVAAVKSKAAAIAKGLETAATEGSTVATKAATVAQAAFNAVAKANPYVLLATVAIAAATAIYGFVTMTQKSEFEEKKAQEAEEAHKKSLQEVQEYYDKTGKSVEGLEEIQAKQPALWQKLSSEAQLYKKSLEDAKSAHDKIGEATGELVSKFMTLQVQWKNLRTEAEKKKFIDDNKSAFNELGLSVNSVNDAYNTLVKNAPQVIAALKAIAEAQAYQDLYKDAVKDRVKNYDLRKKGRDTGDYYTTEKGGKKVSALTADRAVAQTPEWKAAGLTSKDVKFAGASRGSSVNNDYELEKSGIDKINAYRNKQALALNKKIKGYYSEREDMLLEGIQRTSKEAENAQKKLESLGTKIDANGVINGTSGKSPKTTKSGSSKTTKETPLEKYNNTNAEIDAKLKDGLLKEEEAVEDKIKAITTYCDELEKNGKATDADRREIERLKPVLTNLKNKLKSLKIEAEDNKVVKDANEAYANEIKKLNRDRENGWITEDEYNDGYIKAMQTLTDKYKSVININDKLISSINQKQKEIENLSLAKEFDKVDLEVEQLIADFERIMKNQPLGNQYYNEKRAANDKVNQGVRKYNTLENSHNMWVGLDNKQQKKDWISQNQVAATEMGVPKFDVETIAEIGDVSKASKEQIDILDAAIQQLDNALLGINGSKIGEIIGDVFKEQDLTESIEAIKGSGEELSEDVKKKVAESEASMNKIDQKLMDWMRSNAKLVSQIVGDNKIFTTLMGIKDITKANDEETDAFNDTLEKLKTSFMENDDWAKQWGNDFKSIVKQNQTLLDGEVKKVYTVADAIKYAQKQNTARDWLDPDKKVAQKGLIANSSEESRQDYEELVKINYDPKPLEQLQFQIDELKEDTDNPIDIGIEVSAENIDEVRKKVNGMQLDPDLKTSLLQQIDAVKATVQESKLQFNPASWDEFVNILKAKNINLKTELDPTNIPEIQQELGEIKVDSETLKKLEELLDALNKALNKDVQSVTKAAEKTYTSEVKPTGKGGVQNYSLNTTPYDEVEKKAKTFNRGVGRSENGRNTSKTEALQADMDDKLKQYQEAEKKLAAAKEKMQKEGVNIDTSELESQMDNLKKEIDEDHDKIQERLNFQIKVQGAKDALSSLGSLANVGNDLSTLGDRFEEISKSGNEASQAFQYFGLVISTVQEIMTAFETVQTLVNAVQDLFTVKAIAGGGATEEQGAMSTLAAGQELATVPMKTASTLANKQLTASYLELASAAIFAAHASIPFVGPSIAAGLVAEMLATQAAVVAAAQTLTAMANGGIVDGGNFHGDTTLIRANKGEMILNNQEQKNLFDVLSNGGGMAGFGGEVEFKISGDALYGTLKNHKKIKSKTGHSISL